MATSLYWKAWELSNSVYDALLFYRFTMCMNTKTELFVKEKRKHKQIALLGALLIITICVLMYLYLIIHALAISKIPIQMAKVIRYVFTCGVFALCLILALIILTCGHTIAIQHYNTLVDYEKRIIEWSSKKQRDGKGFPLRDIVKQEFTAFRNKKPVDINGILLNVITLVLMLIGVLIAPAVVIRGTDPVSQIFILAKNSYTSNMLSSPIFQAALFVNKYIIFQWCTLETTRIYVSLCIPTMTICTMYLNILKVIRSRSLNLTTLMLYHQLHCINQIGMRVIANIAGAFMGVGFILLIMGNWVVFSGWNVVPVQIYLLIAGIMGIEYFVMFQTIPLAISSNEFSHKIIAKWKANIWREKGQIKYWTKMVKAQQPISFYYAVTKFERDTQVNYYSAVIDYTINALLLF